MRKTDMSKKPEKENEQTTVRVLDDPPNPGSKEAQNMGCLCPVLDNAKGKGYMGIEGVFVYRQDCPIHCANGQALSSERSGD